jgi:hypothetical protein
LGDGHDVQAGVQLPIPGPGQAVTNPVAGGHLDRRGAVERGERGSGAESGDRAHPGEDLAGHQGADAVKLGQGAPGGRDSRGDVLIGGGDASIQAADLADQVGGQPAQGLLQRLLGRTPRSNAAAVAALNPAG